MSALEVHAHTSVAAIGAAAWDGLVQQASPFLRYSFLHALEASGCVGDQTGWLPLHLAVYRDKRLVGLAPAFIKAHSMGEFVYDWAWADAAQRLGIAYYPKLVLAAPFSPVAGRRLFVASGEDQTIAQALLHGAVQHARHVGCSGVHVLFCTQEEVALAGDLGFAHRLGCQFHWTNPGYVDFEAFLSRFDSKRRNQIRRERRRVREQGVEVTSHRGDAVDDALVAPAFEFYGATVDRYVWGRRYLNRRFFELLWRDQRHDLQLMVARRGHAIVGGSINLQADVGAGGLRRFGRYWGATAEIDALHFEVCSYAAIEDCIRTGVTAFEAGAGGEQHKLVRGFLPTPTHSTHLLFEPRFHAAVDDFCQREARHVGDQIEQLREGVFVR
jgi:predicted N-acyltransferase